ncbi:hypothetical protein [Aquibacillus saliphilus]|uniref:hypothetical protein n=1 Tax=Aquibacillus saliphilus TaxID=1909422 RepID=UPI001CEFC84B|nr:hypothetical protein [Aquibacillus saliphilus]
MRKFSLIFLLYFALGTLLMACGSDEEQTNEDSDGKIDVDVSTNNEAEDEQEEDVNEDESTLPDEVPSDFPFPDGANLEVVTNEMAGHINYAISFSVSDEIEAHYKKYIEYATSNGYDITTEDKENYSFKSMKESTEGLGVGISDMGSVNIATVTFTVPID